MLYLFNLYLKKGRFHANSGKHRNENKTLPKRCFGMYKIKKKHKSKSRSKEKSKKIMAAAPFGQIMPFWEMALLRREGTTAVIKSEQIKRTRFVSHNWKGHAALLTSWIGFCWTGVSLKLQIFREKKNVILKIFFF